MNHRTTLSILAAVLLALRAVAQAPTLHAAAAAGDIDGLEKLLQQGAPVDTLEPNLHNTPLLAALAADQPDAAVFLLDRGANPTAVNVDGKTPLHYAATGGHADLIKRLRAAPGALAKVDARGRLPLHHAAHRDREAAVPLLLPRPGLLGLRDSSGQAPLDLALLHSGDKIVLALLDAGAPVDDAPAAAELRVDAAVQRRSAPILDAVFKKLADRPQRRRALLTRACEYAVALGNPDLLDHLLATDPNALGPSAGLFIAATNNQPALVLRFLDARADPNAPDSASGWTPLHAAATVPGPEIARILLERGADPNRADALGRTPLHVAAIIDRPGIVARLLRAGADPARLDQLGNSSLHYAAQSGSLPLVKRLVELGAPESPNAAGLRPLDLAPDEPAEIRAVLRAASKRGNAQLTPEFEALILSLVSEAPAEAASSVAERWTAVAADAIPLLHIAVQAASLDSVRRLLTEDPKRIAERDPAGFLPIHYAAELPDTAILNELLARGAPINDNQNLPKWTPLHFAAAANNTQAQQRLRDKGADPNARDGQGLSPAELTQPK